jgi:hypothetical protein
MGSYDMNEQKNYSNTSKDPSAEAEKQKKIDEASAQMDNSRDYSPVDKNQLKNGDSGNYYWALVNDGNGNYTLKKIEYYSKGEYDEYYFELDNSGKNIKKDTNGKNIKINSNNIEKLWEKSYCQVFLENLVQVPIVQVQVQVQEPVEKQKGTERIPYEKES